MTIYFTGNTAVHPGETVFISGSDLDSVASVTVSRLDDKVSPNSVPQFTVVCEPDKFPSKEAVAMATSTVKGSDPVEAEIFQRDNTGFMFVLPSTFKMGVFAATLKAKDGTETTVYINHPSVKWAQGNCGAYGTKGSEMRLCGEKLSLGDDSKVKIVLEQDGVFFDAKITRVYDAYSIGFAIPDELENGEYKAYVSNGFGGNTAWSVPVTVKVGEMFKNPEKIFNVCKYGADKLGEEDSTKAVRAAIEDIKKNNGGVLFFPKGRFRMTGEIELPSNTTLRGESAALTQVFWFVGSYEFGTLPSPFIKIHSNVIFEHIEFRGTRVIALIGYDFDDTNVKNVIVNDVHAYFNAYAGSEFHITESANRVKVSEEILKSSEMAALLRLKGDNIQITNSEFAASGMTFGDFKHNIRSNVLFKNNRIQERMSGWCYLARCEHSIIEDNDFEGCTLGVGGGESYIARNHSHDILNNDRETFTTDMSYSKIVSANVKVNGTTLTFPEGTELKEDRVKGGGVYITYGRGVGQARRVVSYHDNVAEINEPFAVVPDENSVLCFGGMYRVNYYLVNNTVRHGGHYQFYTDQTSSVLDGNVCENSAGIMMYAFSKPTHTTVNHFISMVNSTVKCGNYLHKYGATDAKLRDGWSGFSSIGVNVDGNIPYCRGILIRNNELCDNSYLQLRSASNAEVSGKMQSMICENNTFHDSIYGIWANAEFINSVARKNDLSNNVDEPIVLSGYAEEGEGKLLLKDNKL